MIAEGLLSNVEVNKKRSATAACHLLHLCSQSFLWYIYWLVFSIPAKCFTSAALYFALYWDTIDTSVFSPLDFLIFHFTEPSYTFPHWNLCTKCSSFWAVNVPSAWSHPLLLPLLPDLIPRHPTVSRQCPQCPRYLIMSVLSPCKAT